MNLNEQFIEMGKRIKMRRKEFRIRQGELAEKIDISTNHMSAIENGRERPSLEIFIKICTELNITPDFLLLGCIHPNNISQNIVDKLRLCAPKDVKLANDFIELLVSRNTLLLDNSKFSGTK